MVVKSDKFSLTELQTSIYLHQDQQALRHLMRVASWFRFNGFG